MLGNFVFGRDGELANLQELDARGFRQNLTDPRDFRVRGDEEYFFNFVGFVSNDVGDVLAVLPKHFHLADVKADIARLFRLITSSPIGSTNRNIGTSRELGAKTDFPFAAFYEVYAHYQRWGLDAYVDRRFRASPPGRINWRKSIERGSWLPSANGPVPFPVFYQAGERLSTFISECTVFAIDYTLERFGVFLGLPSTGVARPNFDLEIHREHIVESLRSLRAQTFRDTTVSLIDSLIDFYSLVRLGGGFYFKQYSFSLIWEVIVLSYLNRHFAGFDDQGDINFQSQSGQRVEFTKGRFAINAAYAKQALEPDYYGVSADGKSQYILDAKYYSEVKDLNYKQLSYTILLDSLLGEGDQRRFERTYSTLILPSAEPRTNTHFVADSKQSGMASDMRVTEAYLNIREVVEDFMSG